MDARSGLRCVLIACLGMMMMPARGAAQTALPPNLSQLSIEDLMNVEITSASRKEQRSVDVAAAVYVITHQDIARSGLTSIPDLLRLVPGVQVAALNASHQAVSIRGFNDLFSNKLLVLVDGRSTYNRIFSGVLWDSQDLMLEDVERIEVIRGPGAAQWGANAVNGVINIVTKSAADTRGVVVRGEAGTHGGHAAARYGGSVAAMDYRVFAKVTDRVQSVTADGARANDPSQAFEAGVRADRRSGANAFMFVGGVTAGRMKALWMDLDPQATAAVRDERSTTTGGHALGRWTLARANGAAFQLQSYFDIENRNEPVGDYSRSLIDIDAQYRMPIGTRHDLLAGAAYRFDVEGVDPAIGISLVPATSRIALSSVFAHDEISFFDKRVLVTLGTQAQYDSLAGFALQPSARVMWKARPGQRLWAATSRAVRTPSLSDTNVRLATPAVPTASGLPLVVKVTGNPDLEPESLVDVEAGYRREWGTVASIDLTAFRGWYDSLVTSEASAPVLEFTPSPRLVVPSTFGNGLRAATRGVEVSAHWVPAPAWRFDANYSVFHITPKPDAASTDPAAALADGNTPATQWQLVAAFSPSARLTLYTAIHRVGRLRQANVAAYTRADVNARFDITSRLTVMAIGQNLLRDSHVEHAATGGGASLMQSTEVPRSVSVRLRWALR